MNIQTGRRVAPIGSLLKGATPVKAKKNATAKHPGNPLKTPRVHDAEHLEAIRQCPCLSCGIDPCGEAAHVRMADAERGKRLTGKSEKPDDKYSLPLCPNCHQRLPNSLHNIGEKPFFEARGLDPIPLCDALHKLSPNVEGMRALCFVKLAGAV
jgi:hypothetical protein